MDSVHAKVGKIVRDYRLKKGMTQQDLSSILGYETTQFVSFFERGISKIPLATLGKLIVILGMPEKKVVDSMLLAYRDNLKVEITEGKRSVKR